MATKERTHEWTTIVKLRFAEDISELQITNEILPVLSEVLNDRMDTPEWGKYGFEDFMFSAPTKVPVGA
jgi:predicted PP-loop superfamily ATPase